MNPTPTEDEVREAFDRLSAWIHMGLPTTPKSIRGDLELVLPALQDAQADTARLIETFRHTHVNGQDGTDRCKSCGLDLRDEIHRGSH